MMKKEAFVVGFGAGGFVKEIANTLNHVLDLQDAAFYKTQEEAEKVKDRVDGLGATGVLYKVDIAVVAKLA